VGAITTIGCFLANVCLASTLLTGDLGRWLNDKAFPALVQSLANHPRFRGETVRVVAMRDGAPVPTTERLTQELQRELTHQLSEQDAVRIALPDAPKPCDLPEDRPFLLGVEVVPVQGKQYRVNIAVVDRDEGVWVNGLNLRWEGTLTRTQRAALSQATSTGTPGSVGEPIPIADHRAVVDQLASQMECVLRSGVSGTLALKPTEHTALVPIVRELGARASALPGVMVTAPTDNPDWLLTTDLGGTMDRGSAELVLSLAPRDGGAPPQRVASIWISQPVAPARPAVASAPPRPPVAPAAPPRASIVPPAPPRPSIVPPAPPIASAPPRPPMSRVAPVTHGDSLMTPLRAVPSPATGICVRSNAEGRCVDIELGLASAAYLFVFHTDPTGVHVHACRDQPLTANAGAHRYRLTLERPSADTIDVYAVATREPDLARLLNDVLRAGPGACGARGASPGAWFGRFKMLVDRYGLRIDWRSVHMSPDFRVLAMRSGE
jgi:hypothetical protein